MENPRTTSARDHDDHAVIDAAVADADTGIEGTAGGGQKAQDVASQMDEAAIADPDNTHDRPAKADDMHHGDAYGNPSRGRGQSGV